MINKNYNSRDTRDQDGTVDSPLGIIIEFHERVKSEGFFFSFRSKNYVWRPTTRFQWSIFYGFWTLVSLISVVGLYSLILGLMIILG